MQIFTDFFNDIHPGYPIETMAPLDKILFIDIETTGLSRELTDLYLIGCGYFNKNGYNTIQWFADSPEDEAEVIQAFYDFVAGRFELLIHYNGNHFDIPYLKAKALKHDLALPFKDMDNYDIYLAIKPFKNALSLPSLRQRCVEELLEINSDDPYSGRDLIGVYHKYVSEPSDDLLYPLLYHNSEDLKGMAYILPVIYYTHLKDISLEYVSHGIHKYHDLQDNEHMELLVTYKHDIKIPKGFNFKDGNIILHISPDGRATLRLPLINTTLKRFYPNYKDYYYLPAEDTCIYKSAASSVPRERRENAKKETCYTKHSGLFIPILSGSDLPVFKSDHSSKEIFTPFIEEDHQKIFTIFGDLLISHAF
ncbi:MAG: ribonuclease H-like domain-containing protein [Lachnospiraceae bacterium]|nr:ribonuclease H-like domain-containing protein [Lachnospiraceae bacterium]